MNRMFRSLAFYLLILLVVISIANMLASDATTRQELDYSQFIALVENERVETATIIDGTSVVGTLRDGTEFEAIIPADTNLYSLMQEKGVQLRFELPPQPPWWTALITTMLPVLLIVGVFFFVMQQTQGSGNKVMQFGRSKARMHSTEGRKPAVTFDDVAGCDEVKEELQEVVDFLRYPKRYLEMGARIPKGLLLFGSPGTGKTLIARAVAGEAGVPFFSNSGSDFVEMFVGVGASRVRDLFEQAKRQAPAIVFIDEIDAVGRMRGAGYGGGHDEREQTLNQLLVEMDGFAINEGIIIIAATNRPDVLDPALLRPGRFDRQVTIDRPDVRGRLEILKVHIRGKSLDKDVDLEVIAKRTPGFTGADLENLVNEASLLAVRRRSRFVMTHDLEEAIDRVVAGPMRKSRLLSDKEKKTVAFHEAAHALVAKLLPNSDPVHKVSIVPRGAALGYVLQLPMEDRYLITKSEILDRITSALAGRVAEQMIFGEISTGASDDLEKSTKLVRRMIMEFGMSEALGPLTFGTKQDQVFLGRDISRDRNYSEEVAAAIDQEVRKVITECYDKAETLIQDNIDKLHRLAEQLLEKETLEGSDLEEILNGVDEKAS